MSSHSSCCTSSAAGRADPLDALDVILGSPWLRLLERLEAPARLLHPARGTVRVQLEVLRRRLVEDGVRTSVR